MGKPGELPTLQRHKLSRRDVERMLEAGIPGEDQRVELIEGELVDRAPTGSAHSGTVTLLIARLRRVPEEAALLLVQQPIELSPICCPEPDLTLILPRGDFYRGAHPGSADVLLVIEVADSSVAYDRDVKIPLYARHGIRETWLVDLAADRLVIHRRPRTDLGEYEQIEIRHDGRVSPQAFPDAVIDVAELLS